MFTEKQRRSILDRDDHTSQMRHYTEDKGFHTQLAKDCKDCDGKGCGLQVHHIDPRRNGGGDTADNLITLFQCEHNGKKTKGKFANTETEFVIHEDMIETFKDYRNGNKNAFIDMSERRNKTMQSGEIYWNPDHDEEMKETALERTLNASNNGWRYPGKKR